MSVTTKKEAAMGKEPEQIHSKDELPPKPPEEPPNPHAPPPPADIASATQQFGTLLSTAPDEGPMVRGRVWDKGELHRNGKRFKPGQAVEVPASEVAELGEVFILEH